MKFITRFLCVPVAGLLALTSCAKDEDESYVQFENQALEAWMTQHRPDLVKNYQPDGGYYIDVIDAGEPDKDPLNKEPIWVSFDFTGRDLAGNIILTRSASDAKLTGAFSKYTHYVPFYRYCGTENTGLMEGTWLAMRNTLVISALKMFIGFPLPIFFAVLLNEMNFQPLKKTVQTVSYLPHFISTVVMAGMLILFLSPSTGIIAKLVGLLGFKLPNLMGSAKAFPHIYVWSEAWQHVGWDSILYIATLSSVDPTLYEAATMDGANKWHKMIHIDVPALLPTATIMFIMRMGSVMSVGFEKVYLLQNTLNSTSSEIISTYVYKMGLVSSQYSLSAAIGLFNNIINLVLLLAVNFLSSKMSDTSLI